MAADRTDVQAFWPPGQCLRHAWLEQFAIVRVSTHQANSYATIVTCHTVTRGEIIGRL